MRVWLQEYPALNSLPAEIDALFAASPGLFFGRAWWGTVVAFGLPPGTRPCFLLARIDDRPAALLPLRIDADGTMGSLTTPYTCLYAPLLAPDLPDAALVRFSPRSRGSAAAGRPHGWTRCRTTGPRYRHSSRVRGGRDWRWCASPISATGMSAWRGLDWAALSRGRPGALRETIRRKLAPRGAARAMPDSSWSSPTPMRLEPGIDASSMVYARSWKRPEPFPRFNAGLMRGDGRCRAVAAGLLADRRACRWRRSFGSWRAGTATVLKLAHDEAFRRQSRRARS